MSDQSVPATPQSPYEPRTPPVEQASEGATPVDPPVIPVIPVPVPTPVPVVGGLVEWLTKEVETLRTDLTAREAELIAFSDREIKAAEKDFQLLSGDLHNATKEAAIVAGTVGTAMGVFAAVVAGIHIPGLDTVATTAITSIGYFFVRWATAHGWHKVVAATKK